MTKNKAIYAVTNTIKKPHIQKDIHFIYTQDLYEDKQKEIFELFIEYLVPITEYLDYPAFIE